MNVETPAERGLENSAGGPEFNQNTAPLGHLPELASRVRPMALDSGHSSHAAASASAATLGLVRQRILELLRERPGTDEELSVRYNERTAHPAWPKVTDQRLRTARSHLVRDSLVRDTGQLAFSSLGHRSTCWEAIA